MMTFRQLRYFVAVCESGKINHAASELGISASAISSALKELQELAGVRLLERHRRGVFPTPEGRVFLQHCKQILASVVEAFQDLPNTDQSVNGDLQLGTTMTVAGYFLCTPLDRFTRAYRNIDVEVTEALREDLEERIIEGELDIALVQVSNLKNTKDIAAETLVSSPRRLWARTGHKFQHRDQVTLEDVSKEPYIQLDCDDALAATNSYWNEFGQTPNRVYETKSVEAVRCMVATGRGVTILPDMLYRPWSLDAQRVECRDLSDDIPSMEIGLIWRREGKLSETASAFREYCRSEVLLRRLSSIPERDDDLLEAAAA